MSLSCVQLPYRLISNGSLGVFQGTNIISSDNNAVYVLNLSLLVMFDVSTQRKMIFAALISWFYWESFHVYETWSQHLRTNQRCMCCFERIDHRDMELTWFSISSFLFVFMTLQKWIATQWPVSYPSYLILFFYMTHHQRKIDTKYHLENQQNRRTHL